MNQKDRVEKREPIPPFTLETALQKAKQIEDVWNTKDVLQICAAYTANTEWRSRTENLDGQDELRAFIKAKWERELLYKLKIELWGFRENKMSVWFEYEWQNSQGEWFRSKGNKLWEFDDNGLLDKSYAIIYELPISESERILF